LGFLGVFDPFLTLFDPFLTLFDPFWPFFWPFLGVFDPFWVFLTLFGCFWPLFGYFLGTFWAVFALSMTVFGPLLVTFGSLLGSLFDHFLVKTAWPFLTLFAQKVTKTVKTVKNRISWFSCFWPLFHFYSKRGPNLCRPAWPLLTLFCPKVKKWSKTVKNPISTPKSGFSCFDPFLNVLDHPPTKKVQNWTHFLTPFPQDMTSFAWFYAWIYASQIEVLGSEGTTFGPSLVGGWSRTFNQESQVWLGFWPKSDQKRHFLTKTGQNPENPWKSRIPVLAGLVTFWPLFGPSLILPDSRISRFLLTFWPKVKKWSKTVKNTKSHFSHFLTKNGHFLDPILDPFLTPFFGPLFDRFFAKNTDFSPTMPILPRKHRFSPPKHRFSPKNTTFVPKNTVFRPKTPFSAFSHCFSVFSHYFHRFLALFHFLLKKWFTFCSLFCQNRVTTFWPFLIKKVHFLVKNDQNPQKRASWGSVAQTLDLHG